jgi:predicted aldo/keto reductase-like oxidoreductase
VVKEQAMKKNNPWTRREFIAKPAAFLAASQLANPAHFLFAEAAAPGFAAGRKILTRTLGRTGIKVPLISSGMATEESIIRRAYECGVRLFESSANYKQGGMETSLGNAIKAMGVRKDVVLATKLLEEPERKTLTSAQAGKMMAEEFEDSLKNLQTDYVDILYLHGSHKVADVSMEGPLEVLVKAKKEGKIRAIGISTHNAAPILDEVVRVGVHDVVLIPFNWTMESNQELFAAIERAHKKGIGLVAMKTTSGGFLKPGEKPVFMAAMSEGATQSTTQYEPPAGGPTPKAGFETGAIRTAMLKWVLHHDAIATLVSGFATFDHVEQNVGVAYDISYTEEEKKILADKKLMASLEYCDQCKQCLPTCPYGAEIPTLMRAHMYALQYYPGTGRPHETLASIAAGRGLDACANCENCTAACAKTVNIPRKIGQLQAWHASVQG